MAESAVSQSSFENTRYNRHVTMPEWGSEGQKALSRASVAVIGAGGVKATLLLALAAAGIGRIKIIEFDRIELSNLNRQLLFRTDDIGRFKGEVAQEALRALNPDVDVAWVNDRLVAENMAEYLADVDFVSEGADNFRDHRALNEYCLRNGKPYTHCSAQYSYGYVFSVVPAWQTACFSCYYPQEWARTADVGPVPVNVLATQLAGTLGATEILRYLLGHHDPMHVNRRLAFSSLLLSGDFELLPQLRRPDCVCASIYASVEPSGAAI
jgi:molybdopterin-synthase adenylyltransferase